MRQSNPKIIISTTTLAQGVNLGVSSVIIANIWFDYPGGNGLSQSIFWNIVGRAGRAFIDSEGKVLFAIDQTHSNFRANRLEKDTAHRFLLSENHDNAFSGIILMILELEKIASKYDVNFELLLELISENYEEVDTPISEIEFNELQNKLDLIDDTLLSLNDKRMSWLEDDTSEWIDSFFRQSLAYIQSENHGNIDGANLIRYLKKRNTIILKKAGDHTKWKEHINTGIPLRSSIKLSEILINFEILFNQFQESDKSFASLIDILSEIEGQIYSLPGEDFRRKDRIGNSDITSQNRINAKILWLNGTPYSEIENSIGKQKASYFCNDFFSFTLPWALNAIARKFNRIEKDDIAEFYENLSVILEIGVPNIQSAKIYLAGFRSRKVAVEIAGLISFSMDELTLSEIREELLVLREQLLPNLSIDCISWFDLLEEEKESNNHKVTKIPNFVFKSGRTYPIAKLIPRLYKGKTYLCTPDLSKKILLSYDAEIFPFDELVNKPGIYFENRGNVWCYSH